MPAGVLVIVPDDGRVTVSVCETVGCVITGVQSGLVGLGHGGGTAPARSAAPRAIANTRKTSRGVRRRLGMTASVSRDPGISLDESRGRLSARCQLRRNHLAILYRLMPRSGAPRLAHRRRRRRSVDSA